MGEVERAPAGHLEAWLSFVTLGRSLPPLGPDDERVGPPDQGTGWDLLPITSTI